MSQITHQQWLSEAAESLAGQSDTAMLDARVLLCFVLNKPLSYLLTWPERLINPKSLSAVNALCNRRHQGEPIAYITGHREFWSLNFKVTPDVLIPRPETELMVELALEAITRSKRSDFKVLELGTGSGAIAVALASEHPELNIVATDYSEAALNIARENAESNNCDNIQFLQGSWFECLNDEKFDLILSNPPYVAPSDPHLSAGDLPSEPYAALVADNNGLADIEHIIAHAQNYLIPEGMIALEHGYNQAQEIRAMMTEQGFRMAKTHSDLANIDRVTSAIFS